MDILTFRDQSSTLTGDGKKRQWMYPKLIRGKLYRYRSAFSIVLLTMLFAAPFLKINGEQLVLLNILQRRFAFFGIVFLPQDFYIFVLAMLSFIVFIVLFTIVFGRVWCGWACPQTIFMEMVFRRIEYWIEGNHQQQKKLDAAPLSFTKALKKGSKHTVFFLVSFGIANVFLAYLIGSDELIKIIKEPPAGHFAGLASLLVFTCIFYLVFARLRELVCIVVCPYGRLQGVLLDNQSIQVAYDYLRGEPRGKRKRNSRDKTGDCVDCHICVDVCPTGIDIRNGSQLECISCTACIDACNGVMSRLNYPPGLIGFKSEEQIKTGSPFKISRRVYAYAAVLAILIVSLGFLMMRRSDIETTVYRASGTLYQERPGGMISNLYMAELVNKTTRPLQFRLETDDPSVRIEYITTDSVIASGGIVKLTFFILCRKDRLKDYKSEIRLNVFAGGKKIDQVNTNFISPFNAD